MDHFYLKLERNELTLSSNNVLIFEGPYKSMHELLRHWISKVNYLKIRLSILRVWKLYKYIDILTHIYTHTYRYICMYVYGCVCVIWQGMRNNYNIIQEIIELLNFLGVTEIRPSKSFACICMYWALVLYFSGKSFWKFFHSPFYAREGHLNMLFWIDLYSVSTLSPRLEWDP